MKINDWLQKSSTELKNAGVTSARLDSLIMLETILGLNRNLILAHSDDPLKKGDLAKLESMIKKRRKRIPMSYIIGTRDFFGYQFIVNKSVLVPRPETEYLVEYAIKNTPRRAEVLELGTGSGAIAITLSLKRPDLNIIATDISKTALNVARQNNTALEANIELITSDLFSAIRTTYDLILANLPYVPVNARRQAEITHEPDVALYSGDDGLDLYRRFFNQADTFVKPAGQLIVEFSPTQFSTLRDEFKSQYTITPVTEYIYTCKPTTL